MALPARDGFTAADGTALTTYSANWTLKVGNYQINTNALSSNLAADETAAYWNADAFPDDQYAQLVVANGSSLSYIGPAVRMSASTVTYYGVYSASGERFFFKRVSGSWVQLGYVANSPAIGTIFRLEADGTTITPFKTGAIDTGLGGAQTDSSIASGFAGVCGWGANTGTRMDNWEAGGFDTPSIVLADLSGADGTAYSTASVSLLAGRLYILFVNGSHSGAAEIPSSITGNGTWDQIITQSYGNAGARRLTAYRQAPGSTSTAAITINYSTTHTSTHWSIIQVPEGYDTSGSNGSGAIGVTGSASSGSTVTELTVTLSAFQNADSVGIGAIGCDTTNAGITPLNSYVELSETTSSSPIAAVSAMIFLGDADPGGSIGTAARMGGVGLEVKAAGAAGGDLSINVSDSITVSETVVALVESYINKTESVTVAESVNAALAHQVSVSDSVTVAETVSALLVSLVSVSDAITVAEAVTAYLETAIAANESITVSEAVTLVLESYISVADAVSVAEAVNVALAHQVNVSDAVTVAESIAALLQSHINVSDAVTVEESVTVSVVEAGTLAISVSDAITVAETITLLVESYINVNEAISVSESVSVALAHQISATDTVAVAEAVNVALAHQVAVADAITVTDAPALLVTVEVIATETITVAEAVTVVVLAGDTLAISVSESIVVAETVVLAISTEIAVSELVTVAETVGLLMVSHISVTDAVTLAEAVTVDIPLAVTAMDAITVSEAVTVVMPDSLAINVSEGISIAELVTVMIVAAAQIDAARFKGMYRGMFKHMR